MAATDKPSPALVRWAFNIRQPAITPQLTATLLAYVQPEERARIQQFKFAADQHRALFGRLLMRCLLFQVASGLNKRLRPSGLPHADSTVPQVNWWTIQLTRTTENKPVLSIKTQQLPAFQLCLTNDPGTSTEPASIPLAFNVSHHGDWVVLVAGYARHLGVDVSEVDFPRAESLDDYFALMQAQFTPHEWHLIRPTDPRGLAKTTCLHSPTHPSPSCSRCYAQLTQFHRLWCLKESYVKAKGVGLNLNLQRIEFHHIAPAVPHSANPSLSAQDLELDVAVHLDGQIQPSWRFELSSLDSRHPVAIAYESGPSVTRSTPMNPAFTRLTVEQLMSWLPDQRSLS